MDIQASLEALCSCPGPSGREDAVASQAMELLRPLMDEVKKDRFGNVIGIRRCGTENAKRVVLDAHLDEVGLVITGAKDGFLRFRPVGGPSDASQPGSHHPLPAPPVWSCGCPASPCSKGRRLQPEHSIVGSVY